MEHIKNHQRLVQEYSNKIETMSKRQLLDVIYKLDSMKSNQYDISLLAKFMELKNEIDNLESKINIILQR